MSKLTIENALSVKNRIYAHVSMNEMQEIQDLILSLMGCLNNRHFGGADAVSDSTVIELHNRVDKILHYFSGVPLV